MADPRGSGSEYPPGGNHETAGRRPIAATATEHLLPRDDHGRRLAPSDPLTQTWVDTDGEHVVINAVEGFLKLRNIAHDPRMAVAIDDPTNRFRYKQIQGRVVETTTEGGAEHIEAPPQKYLGQPYAWHGGRDQIRVILKFEADKISGPGRSPRGTRRRCPRPLRSAPTPCLVADQWPRRPGRRCRGQRAGRPGRAAGQPHGWRAAPTRAHLGRDRSRRAWRRVSTRWRGRYSSVSPGRGKLG